MQQPFGRIANSSMRDTGHAPVSAAEMDQILGSTLAVAQPPTADHFEQPSRKKRTWFPPNHYFDQIRDEAVIDLVTRYGADVDKITTKVVAGVFWALRQKPMGGDIQSVTHKEADGTVTIKYKNIREDSVVRIDALHEMIMGLV